MLALPIGNAFGKFYTNQANGSLTPGTQLTSGAINTKGSYASLATAANLDFDVHYVTLCMSSGTSSSNQRSWLVDFAWDPAGGTSYTNFFSNLVCGGAGTIAVNAGGGRHFHFPCYIPAGSQVAMRAQCNTASQTIRAWAYFWGKPSRPELWRRAAYAETIGSITNSQGVTFTPGNAADGSWTTLGTTSKPLWWWQLGAALDTGTMNGEIVRVQLATGDASNKHIIIDTYLHSINNESVDSPLQMPCYWEVPAGGSLFVRGNCNDAPDSPYTAVAVGFGG